MKSPRQTILIVDDKPKNLFALERTLLEVDASAVKAENGNDALAASLNHDFALAILDVQMPDMDGFELAEYLRGEKKTENLPIIFLTAALFEDQHIFRGYKAGAVDYIIKPYEPAVLLSKVNVFLKLDRQRIELDLYRQHLESVIEERTEDLVAKHNELKAEFQLRVKAEEELRAHRDRLEELVEERTHALRKRTEELEAVNRELDAFAYAVSHDLRSPLRGIKGYLAALQKSAAHCMGEKEMELFTAVTVEADRMDALIGDVLKLARAAKSELRLETVDITALAGEIVNRLLKSDADRKVSVHIADGLAARGDKQLIRQVMENLIGNAWKYTGKTAAAEIEINRLQNEAKETVFFVKDNGAGFNMSYSENIFTPFKRLHSPREFPGTGVGLSTVKRIIDRHNGRIWFDSEVDKGAVFYFVLNPTETLPATSTVER